jgi:hypothetical protein
MTVGAMSGRHLVLMILPDVVGSARWQDRP